MDEERHDPLGDVINLLAAPIASGLRAVEQYRRGVDEMFRAIDNLNRTMENLNETAERVNRLLNDVEEPVRAMASVPQRVDDLVGIMSEMSRRLSPVVSLAESASGMFGFWPGVGGSKESDAGPSATTDDTDGATGRSRGTSTTKKSGSSGSSGRTRSTRSSGEP